MVEAGSLFDVWRGKPAMNSRRKAASWGAARAIVQMACSFVSIKLTAVYLGPSGLALIAQFNNFMILCHSVVTTGLETATSRLGAEYQADAARRGSLLNTVGKIGLGFGLLIAMLVAVGSPWLADRLLKDSGYTWVFILGALSIVPLILNGIFLSALSAQGEVARVVLSNIVAAVCGLLIFAPASIHWGVSGGLFASSTIYFCSLLVTIALTFRVPSFNWRDFVGRFDRSEARRIAGFYPMLIVHAIVAPLSLIVVREHVSTSLNLESAGLWQACWRLSETYLMVVMSTVTTQFMVRLGAAINSPHRFRAEVLSTLALAVGATAAFAVVIYIFREWVIRFIFSAAFLPVTDLLPGQLAGDVLKIAGITLGFVLVATMRSAWYISIALIVPAVFIAVARLLDGSGVQGVITAYVVSGVVHCVLSLVALRDLLPGRGGISEG